MGWLFLAALLFAWPTFGLSLLAWFAWAYFSGRSQGTQSERRRANAVSLEPLFKDRFAEFFWSLDVPIHLGSQVSREHAHQCGRHIMNYMAHNPSEAGIFVSGLQRRQAEWGAMDHPVSVARRENAEGKPAEIHSVSWRAIEALMKQNRNLACFRSVDLRGIELRLDAMKVRNPHM